MKNLFVFIMILFSSFAFSQKVDTVIDKKIYKSYFSFGYKEPLYVEYILSKGGGECDRSKFHFHNDTKIKTATAADYSHQGYDEGHLANSEDFSGNCVNDELTFRFYNCLPQTPNLNRGVWKHWETELRKLSQTDSLYIICGGIFEDKNKKIGDNVLVPTKCWKIAFDLKTHKIVHCLIFTNDNQATCNEISLKDLLKVTKFNIDLPNYIK